MVMATAGASRVQDAHTTNQGRNVGDTERIVSVVSGGALAAYGLGRRDLPGLAMALLGGELMHRGASGHCVLYEALGVTTADGHAYPVRRPRLASAAATVNAREAVRIERSVTINRPRSELYGVWRDFTSLPRYIADLESVTDLGNGRSRWVAVLPGGKHVEWTAEIVTQRENEIVSWKTVDDSDVAHAGSVIFRDAPAGRGTEMKIEVDYEPPGGPIGALTARFMGIFGQSPDAKVREDLRRFKMQMETGEVATTDGQPDGR
jgi:uncharacterized membrane protein